MCKMSLMEATRTSTLVDVRVLVGKIWIYEYVNSPRAPPTNTACFTFHRWMSVVHLGGWADSSAVHQNRARANCTKGKCHYFTVYVSGFPETWTMADCVHLQLLLLALWGFIVIQTWLLFWKKWNVECHFLYFHKLNKGYRLRLQEGRPLMSNRDNKQRIWSLCCVNLKKFKNYWLNEKLSSVACNSVGRTFCQYRYIILLRHVFFYSW